MLPKRRFRPSLPAILTLGVAALVGVLTHQTVGVTTSIAERSPGPDVSMEIFPIAFAQDGSKLVKVQAVAEKTHLVAGETNWIGMVFNVSRGWHIYWRNPGTGMPTSWKLKDAPDGITLGDAIWPTPERYETQFGIDFVHHGRAFVMIPVEVGANVADLDEVSLEIEANWLVCKEICVPGSATASLTLPVAKSTGEVEDARAARAFKRARDAAPEVVEDLEKMGITTSVQGTLSITKEGASELAFFPYENDEGVYPNKGKEDLHKKSDTLTIRYPGTDLAMLDEVKGLLVVGSGDDAKTYEITVPVR